MTVSILSVMQLIKMTAAGNDFIFLDLRTANKMLTPPMRMALAQTVCHRTSGIGADGFVFIEKGLNADFAWDFYNADGSKAEMCGNAARCAVRYYYWQSRSNQQTMSFETLAGVISGQVLPSGMVEVVMPQAKYFQWNLNETIAGDSLLFDWINSGVPHAVVQIHENSRFQSLKPMAKALREHHRFAPGGTNVTLFRWLNTERIAAQTYERGVEDFTLACGTGAVAVGLVAFQKRPELRAVEIQMPGGVLSVSNEAHPRLTGPAELIAKIEWLG